ncbi:MAG TPA: hypothetical protein VMV56_06025 [Williamwhitmania sp.]|nr:hypothetical protein [Williamwhitmania sp.]
MDNRKIELERRFAEVILSTYQPENNPSKEALVIPTSRVLELMEELEPPMTIEPFEVLVLMEAHKFDFTRKNGEFWYLVKEKRGDKLTSPSDDFY